MTNMLPDERDNYPEFLIVIFGPLCYLEGKRKEFVWGDSEIKAIAPQENEGGDEREALVAVAKRIEINRGSKRGLGKRARVTRLRLSLDPSEREDAPIAMMCG